jgi:peptidoglycan/LPS O-acetylase OafA/YrhL
VNVLFFLPALALGMWFSEDHNLFSRHNRFLAIYAPICVIFMIDYTTHALSNMSGYVGEFFSRVDTIFRGDYTLLFYGYAAVIMLLVLMNLPQAARGSIQRFVQKIGRASYHIFLFQIFWMSIVYWITSHEATYFHEIPVFNEIYGWSTPLLYIPFYLMNLTIALAGGLLWYQAEKWASARGKPWWCHAWFRRAYHLFGALLSLLLMGSLVQLVSDITGLTEWSRNNGPYFVLNEVTGPGFVADFIVIILSIGICIMLMAKALAINDDEIPI